MTKFTWSERPERKELARVGQGVKRVFYEVRCMRHFPGRRRFDEGVQGGSLKGRIRSEAAALLYAILKTPLPGAIQLDGSTFWPSIL
jgi:hypothetical protein